MGFKVFHRKGANVTEMHPSAVITFIIIMALLASPIYTSSAVISSIFVLEDIRSSVVDSAGEALLSGT